MKKRMFAICLGLALLLAGCGGGGSNGAAGGTAPASPDNTESSSGSWTEDEDWAGQYWGVGVPAPDVPTDEGASVYQRPDAKLIRRATLEIQTEQFDQSKAALDQLAAECGGYFENSIEYGGSYRDAYANRNGEYVIRVPAEKYSQFLNSAGDLGYVTHKNESSEDIGERYYDTEARLKTQRTKQERLLALLEKAESMEDIISLENALSDVEYQIEQYSSELNRYDGLISFSTFTVHLCEVSRVTQEVGETASLGQRMAAGFQASVRNLSRGCQDFLIWISYNVFLLVVLAVVAAVGVIVGNRELKKRRKQNKREPEEE